MNSFSIGLVYFRVPCLSRRLFLGWLYFILQLTVFVFRKKQT